MNNAQLRTGATTRSIKIGLCGFTMAIAEYPRWFSVVEVQQTFYQPPAAGVMRRWLKSVPPGFEFTIKAWQLITHTAKSPTYRRLRRPLTNAERLRAGAFQDSPIVDEAWRVTKQCATLLGATAIVFQCPASFRPTDQNLANLDRFFSRIDRPANVRMLWEPRGTWPADLVSSICQSQQLVHVVDPFVNAAVTPNSVYYRLHGITGSRHVYSDEELIRLRQMLPKTGESHVMFNNIPRVNDARRFGQMLATEGTESTE